MTNDNRFPSPETAYSRIEVNEAASFPIYGQRKSNEEGKLRRGAKYTRAFTPFLAKNGTLASKSGEPIDPGARAFGVLSRETPTDAIGGPYLQLLDWAHNLALDPSERDPNAYPQNMMYVISGPGVGKTHLPKIFSKAFGYHHELIGSGEAGGDIDELIIAHEFNGETAGDISQKINAKLAEPGNALSRRYLIEQLRSSGFLLEDPMAANETLRYQLDREKVMALPQEGKEREGAKEKQLEGNLKKLYQIADQAGIPLKQEAGIGVKKVNGRLLETLLRVKEQYDRSGKAEPVIITLDEFNRFRSFGKKLQNFWEVVGGASSEPVTLMDAAGVPHMFTPDMLRYVYVYMTGNDPKKVPGARDLDHSMLDRIGENRIFRLEDFSQQDWQHRLEQLFLGIGIDLHLRAGGEKDNYWLRNPDDFTDHLLMKRTQGLTATEERFFTPMQDTLIRDWERVHQGTRQAAEFIKAWAEIYDLPDHRVELNRMETRPSITPRLLNHLANHIRSLKVLGGSIDNNFALLDAGKGAPLDYLDMKNLGSKLARFLKSSVDKAHPDPRSGIRHALYRQLYLNGIISKAEAKRSLGDADLSEMQLTSDTQLIEDLLNIDPQKHFSKELRPLQRTLADVLRKQFPELADREDDAIISLPQVATALEALQLRREREGGEELLTDLRQLQLPKIAYKNGAIEFGIVPTVVADATVHKKEEGGNAELTLDSLNTGHAVPGTLVTTPELLLGLALPSRNAMKLANIWEKEAVEESPLARDAMLVLRQTRIQDMEKHMHPDPNAPGTSTAVWEPSEARLLPENHPGGLQTASLHTAGLKPNGNHMHYVPDAIKIIAAPPGDDPSVPAALIIGHTPIDKGLQSYLKEKRQIEYVDANAANAKETIGKLLAAIVENARSHLKETDPAAVDIRDTNTTGLWLHLQNAFDVKLDLSSASADANFSELRKNAIIARLVSEHEKIKNHTLAGSVTSHSWEELVTSRHTEPSAARA